MNKGTSLSLGALWEETLAFVRAEWGLISPVALLGFGLPMLILLLALPVEAAETGRVTPGLWMIWFLPAGLLSMIGSLAISALALRPAISVQESLALAVARMPQGIGLFVLNIGVQVLLALPLSIVGLIEISVGGAAGTASSVANMAALAVTIWLFVRVMPIWALLADRGLAPWAAAREAFRLTRGVYAKLLLLRIVGVFSGVLVLVVMLIPIGGILTLIGRLTDANGPMQTLSFVAFSGVFATLAATWTIYVARLYRRLEV
jgi:hypothetical protein